MRALVVLLALERATSFALRPLRSSTTQHRQSGGLLRLLRREPRGVLRRSSAFDVSSEEAGSWRWTRRVSGGLALLGTCETAFLTYQKLAAETSVSCAGECSSVLTGPYSSVFGVPVSFLGFCAYATVLGLSLAPFAARREDAVSGADEEDAGLLRNAKTWDAAEVDRKTRVPLVVVTSFMATFSAYLVGLLVFHLRTSCGYCFASAAVSFALFFLLQRATFSSPDSKSFWGPTLSSVAAAALAASLSLYAVETNVAQRTALLDETARAVLSQQQQQTTVVFSPPEVQTESSARSLRLAKHLTAKGARCFGAYWCSHCFHQKEIFGREAATLLTYVECAADGADSQRGLCQQTGINGFPTWQIDGVLYPGEKSLAELEALSGLSS
mmetsp:Transcript_23540/g.72417  ORF Transcript_23540/g.72417 Transcript_23540/m.72417 type:complete len:385 (-) Transcript_23540:168-1322(-)